MLKLRWNSQSGAVYVDGQHFKVLYVPASLLSVYNTHENSSDCATCLVFFQHNLELGDEIRLDSHAPYLRIFDPVTPATAAATTPGSVSGFGGTGSSMGSVSVIGSGGLIGGGGVSRDNSSSGDSGVSGISTDDSPFA